MEKPEYPLEARVKLIQGQVWVHLLITETGDVESAEVISGDPPLAEATVKAMRHWKFQPYIHNGHPIRVSTKMSYNFAFKDRIKDAKGGADQTTANVPSNPATSNTASSSPSSDTAASSAPTSDNPPQRLTVSQGVSQGLLLHKVQPVYPESARRKRIQGTVILKAVIGKDGLIKDLHLVSGPPELVQAATGAVQQWRYKPYFLKGEPVEVETVVNVNFMLTPQ